MNQQYAQAILGPSIPGLWTQASGCVDDGNLNFTIKSVVYLKPSHLFASLSRSMFASVGSSHEFGSHPVLKETSQSIASRRSSSLRADGYPSSSDSGSMYDEEEEGDEDAGMDVGTSKYRTKLFCAVCKQPVHALEQLHSSNVSECSCCHRWFHAACYPRYRGAKFEAFPEVQPDGSWLHCPACQKVHELLGVEASTKEAPLRSSKKHTCKLVSCNSDKVQTQVVLGQVHRVLSADFPYALRDYQDFDYAMLVKHNGRPVSAAVFDVYGEELAEVFVLGTRRGERRKGHCSVLVNSLAMTLQSAGVRQLMLSLDEEDAEMEALFTKKFGFEPLSFYVRDYIASEIPNFSPENTTGLRQLALPLSEDFRVTKR